MPLNFILCADDFGMSEGVSRGILEAASAGRISAASAMTSMPDWRRAAKDWLSAAPDADLGLHLNLTVYAPLGPMPLFAPQGFFPENGQVVKGAFAGRLPREEIAAEIARQIDEFTDAMGNAPDHVDGHQHVHVFPEIRALLLQELVSRGLNGVPLRNSSDRLGRILARRYSVIKALKVAALARGFRRDAEKGGFPVNRGFAGFSAFRADADYARAFETYLAAPGPAHLVMCHPGHADDALRRLDPVTDTREAELAFLLSPRFSDVLAQKNAVIQRFASLVR